MQEEIETNFKTTLDAEKIKRTVKSYIKCGWKPVPIEYRKKGCMIEGWTKLNINEENIHEYFNGKLKNVGILLGETSKWLVDIDLDCAEAIEEIKNFPHLTETLRFGRKSKPDSHYLFYCEGAVNRKFTSPDGKTILEIRSTGCQTVFPPSTHETGEIISFSSESTPKKISKEELELAAEMIAERCRFRLGFCREEKPKQEIPTTYINNPNMDFLEAINAYNRDHKEPWPKSNSTCPICGHNDCFGQLKNEPDKWSCFSAAHTGAGSPGPSGNCWIGDQLDIDCFKERMSRVQLLRKEGYLKDTYKEQFEEPPYIEEEHPAAEPKPQTPPPQKKLFASLQEAEQLWNKQGKISTIETPVASLNIALGGGYPVGQITTLVGYTGSHKSEFARHSGILASYNQSVGVIHVDVELGFNRIYERLLSQFSNIAATKLRDIEHLDEKSKNELEDCKDRIRGISNLRIVCPGSGVNLEILESQIKQAITELGEKEKILLILDSAQRLAAGAKGDSPRIQMQSFFWWTENLVRNSNIAAIVISEQKRSQEGGMPSPEEVLTSGAESRSIEFATDVMLGIFPTTKITDEVAGPADSYWESRMKLTIAKSRQGKTGYIKEDIVFSGPCWKMEAKEGYTPTLEERIMDLMDDEETRSRTDICKKLHKRREDVVEIIDDLIKRKLLKEIGPYKVTAKDAGIDRPVSTYKQRQSFLNENSQKNTPGIDLGTDLVVPQKCSDVVPENSYGKDWWNK